MRSGYPLHRSLVLWSGLLVMGFIVWAWVDSTRCITQMKGWGYVLDSRNSGVAMIAEPRSSGPPRAERMDMSGGKPWVMRLGRPGFVRWERFTALRELLGSDPVDPALESHVKTAMFESWFSGGGAKGGRQDGWVCFIPHGMILLGAAMIWTGLLLWRVRRWRKIAGGTVEGAG